jgi:polyphosphate kinase 2 (PPK2 family)
MAQKQTDGEEPAKMKYKVYEKTLRKLQVELCYLQDWVKLKGAGYYPLRKLAMPPARAVP